MTKDEVLACYERTGGILKGHFELTSGRHAEVYMQSAKLFVDPAESELVCKALADKLARYKAEVIVSPALGGVIEGYAVAKHLKIKNIFAEREDGKFALRRGFKLEKGQRVIVVEDVVTTGGSVKEVIELVKGLGAEVVAVGIIIDRSGGKTDFGVPLESLVSMDITSYEPKDCPMCKNGSMAYKPGSRSLK